MRGLDAAFALPVLGTLVGCRLLLARTQPELDWARRVVDALPRRVEKQLLSGGLEVDLQLAGVSVDAAGFRARQLVLGAVGALTGSMLFSGVAGASRIGFSSFAFGGGVRQTLAATLFAAIAPAAGLEVFVKHRAERARDRAAADVATLADLLCIAISSGESVRSGLAMVTNLLEDPLRSEVERVVAAVASGAPFEIAIASMAERSGRPPVIVLAEALSRAHDRGVGLVEQLRSLARDVREAHKAGVVESMGKRQMLMIVPVVFLILPTALVFAALPGFYTLRLIVT